MFAAVEQCSDSSDDGNEPQRGGAKRPFEDVLFCSSSSGERAPVASSGQRRRRRCLGRRMRHTAATSKKERMTNENSLRAVLGKPCHCNQGCFAKFVNPEPFGKFVEFRKQFLSMHKLDQDQVASYS